MSFESFYGGRIGASFVIVKRFDGIDIPEETVYRTKIYAYNGDVDNPIFYVDANNKLIEKNSDNYNRADITWKYVELNGSTLNNVDWDPALTGTSGNPSSVTLDESWAEGMLQCFSEGGDSTNEVNYGEYVIIDTHFGLCRRDDPDNGKVYRRGMDYTGELAGAEYIGQVIGPQGEATDIEITHYDNIQGSTGVYTVSDNDLLPGKDENGNYNDSINYKWCNLRDNYGNIDKALIGFQFPYLVFEWTGVQRSAYYEAGDDIPEGKEVGDRIPDDGMELIERVDDATHPYFEKWRIKLPHGIKGDALKNLEIYPTYAKEGAIIYDDAECTTSTGQIVDEGGLPLDYLNSEASSVSCPLVNGTGYVRFQDGEIFNLRYKQYNYDNRIEGEFHYEDLGEYNMIDDIELAEDGTLTITYTNHEPKVFEKAIQWITDIHMGEDGHFGVHYNTNEIDDPDDPGYYDYTATLKNITDTRIDTGTIEGDGTQNVQVEYSDDGNYHSIGQPLNYILDTYIVPLTSTSGYAGHLLIYYSDPVRRNASPIKTEYFPSARLGRDVQGWTDLGDIRGLSQTPLVFAEYNTFADIPDNPPEVIMGTPGNPNYRYAGWGALYTDGGVQWVAQYDYIAQEWKQGIPYGQGITDPALVINYAPSSGTDSLAPHGFQVERAQREVANETLSNGVVTQLSRKNENGSGGYIFDSTPIGAEVRYIGAQRNSNNNNLEEQLIIGTDADTTITYTDVVGEPSKIKETEVTFFRVGGSGGNCYKITKEKVLDKNYQVDVDKNTLILNLIPHIYSHNETLQYQGTNLENVSSKNSTYTYNNNNMTITTNINTN